MNTEDKKLKAELKSSYDSKTGTAPDFDQTWLAAESRYRKSKRRYRTLTGIAASTALIAIVLSMQSQKPVQPLQDMNLAGGMMSSTQWTAPSDVLMPKHSVDVYQDIPSLIKSIELPEGSLL